MKLKRNSRQPKLQIGDIFVKDVVAYNKLSPSMIYIWRHVNTDKRNLAKSAFLGAYFYQDKSKIKTALQKLKKIEQALSDKELKEDIKYIRNIFLKVKEIDKKV